MSSYRRPADANYGCTDHGCVFGHPGGMGTNGGCRCVPQRPVPERLGLLRGIAAQRERIATLESALAAADARIVKLESVLVAANKCAERRGAERDAEREGRLAAERTATTLQVGLQAMAAQEPHDPLTSTGRSCRPTCRACRIAVLLRAARAAEQSAASPAGGAGEGCHADDDGHCEWGGCPQLRDREPATSGRHCPLDICERCNDRRARGGCECEPSGGAGGESEGGA